MKLRFILPLFVVVLIGIFTFRDSFKLSLFGDDWLHLYIYKDRISQGKLGYSNLDPRSYMSPYGTTFILMGAINKFFSYNPVPYFIASLLFRSLASVSMYIFIFYLTKNKFSAFIASLFLSISEIGIESTNWVFNMNSYIGLSVFLISLVFYFEYHKKHKRSSLFVSVILFSISVMSVPVRMHGAFLIMPTIELFYLILNWKEHRNIKRFILLNIFWATVFVFLYNFGFFGSGNFDIYIGSGLRQIVDAISYGNYSHLLNPLTTIGNFWFPDQFMNGVDIKRIIFRTENLSWMRSFLIPMWIFVFFFQMVTAWTLVDSRKSLINLFCLMFVTSFVLTYLINIIGIRGEGVGLSPNLMFLTMCGGFFLIFVLLMTIFIQKETEKVGLFLSLVWIIGFSIVPLLSSPTSYIVSSMRYLIIPGAGLAIFFGILNNLAKTRLHKTVFLLVIIPFFLIQYNSTQLYFKNLLKSRAESISKEIWKTILETVPSLDPSQDYVFFFDYADDKYTIVRDVITFGFIPRMILYDKTPDRPGGIYVVDRELEFISALKDGEELKRFNWGEAKKIEIKNSFAFRLESDNSLTNVKHSILQKL